MNTSKKKPLKLAKDFLTPSKEFNSAIETILENETIIQMIENNYYKNSMEKVNNADVYLSYIENLRLNDICRKLKLSKNDIIRLRTKGINHFKHNLEILYKTKNK